MSTPTPTRITKLIAYLESEIQSALAEHIELQDPDDLFENNETELAKGWGLVVEGAENSERCHEAGAFYLRRRFTIIITQDLLSQGSDRKLRKAKRDQLLEYAVLLFKRFTGQYSITVDGTTLAFIFAFEGDSGVKEITVNDSRFAFMELSISAEYREPKT